MTRLLSRLLAAPLAFAYMATAADYVWNPQGWEPVESARRAQRLTTIMQALVEE